MKLKQIKKEEVKVWDFILISGGEREFMAQIVGFPGCYNAIEVDQNTHEFLVAKDGVTIKTCDSPSSTNVRIQDYVQTWEDTWNDCFITYYREIKESNVINIEDRLKTYNGHTLDEILSDENFQYLGEDED